MSRSGKRRNSRDVHMKVVIICDDLEFVVNAISTLRRVGRQPGVGATWTTRSWPSSDLTKPAMAEMRLIEAVDAHLVVIPALHAQTFPFPLRHWLQRWATLRKVRHAALGVIGAGMRVGLRETVSPELTLLAQTHGLKLVCDEGLVTDARYPAARSRPERGLPLPIERPHTTYAATSFREFGINE